MANYQSSYTGGQIDTAINRINTTVVPTKTSDLTNDSGFITTTAIPTKVSDLTNDSGFVTSAMASSIASNLINTSIFDLIYPIGSIYMSINSTSPATLFGGSWESISNTFLIAAGSNYTAGSTGGATSHIHTTNDHILTINEIPSHSHTILSGYGDIGNPTMTSDAFRYQYWGGNNRGHNSGFIGNTGSGAAHNHGNTGSSSNMPPYLAVYIWKRIA